MRAMMMMRRISWTEVRIDYVLYVFGPSTDGRVVGEDPWPGQYIDITRTRHHEEDDMAWPRPG